MREYKFTLFRVGEKIEVRNYQETFNGETYDKPQTEEAARVIHENSEILRHLDKNELEVKVEVGN